MKSKLGSFVTNVLKMIIKSDLNKSKGIPEFRTEDSPLKTIIKEVVTNGKENSNKDS